MLNESSEVSIKFARTFKRHLRALSKKYHHIRSDVQPVIETIHSGEFPGDRIQGIEYAVFKVRVRNRDAQKGKSSGYRLIYHLKNPRACCWLKSIRSSTRETFHQIKFEK